MQLTCAHQTERASPVVHQYTSMGLPLRVYELGLSPAGCGFSGTKCTKFTAFYWRLPVKYSHLFIIL